MTADFTHLDEHGNAHMVDVSNKSVTSRRAVSESTVIMPEEIRRKLFSGDLPKGDALGVARVAAILAAKQTPGLIPLCHPIPIDAVDVAIEEAPEGARITVTASTTAKTGIEMETMTAAAVGAVAIYDMVKGLDRSIEIGSVRLLHKSGGKSGEWTR